MKQQSKIKVSPKFFLGRILLGVMLVASFCVIAMACQTKTNEKLAEQNDSPKGAETQGKEKKSFIGTDNSSDDLIFKSDSADLIIIAFLKNMYNNDLYEDYQFLEKHCSPELLKYLRDQYEYDGCEDVCYAVWCFRTTATDAKSLTAESEIISVKSLGCGWYTYEFYDGGYKGKKKIKASIIDGEVIMDKLVTLYDEPSEH